MDREREWLGWPEEDIRQYAKGIGQTLKLSESETASLLRNMLSEVSLFFPKPDASEHLISEADIASVARFRKQRTREYGKLLAKNPSQALYRRTRSTVRKLRDACGFLSYNSDDGREVWVFPKAKQEVSKLLAELMETADRLRKAEQNDNITDQIRLAYEMGVLTMRADFITNVKPELDDARNLAAARKKGGQSSLKGPAMTARQEAYFAHLDAGASPSSAADAAAAELGVSYEQIRNAFPNRRLPSEPTPG
jgi:hypothetical protein